MKPLLLPLVLAIFGLSGPSAKEQSPKTQIESFKTALDAFEVDTGRYPSTAEGLAALSVAPADVTNWKGPYLNGNGIIADPWDHPYVYHCPGSHNTNRFDLYSCGPDGVSKSDGSDPDDINNWDHGSPHFRPHEVDWPRVLINVVFGFGAGLSLIGGVAWLFRRSLKSTGNWHGVIAFAWISTLYPGLSLLLDWDRAFRFSAAAPILMLAGLLIPSACLAISGVIRGCMISRIYSLLTLVAMAGWSGWLGWLVVAAR